MTLNIVFGIIKLVKEMIEGFKITAINLKRKLKVSVHLPDIYYNHDESYPLVIAFDGQDLFDFFLEKTKKINAEKILEESRVIFVGLHSPSIEAWRMSELNPYYNGKDNEVDTVLSYIYYDYIINELLPYLKQKYRITNDIYLLGIEEGAISALCMVYKYDIFTGAGLFNPKLDLCNLKLSADLENHFDKDKRIYMFSGEKKNEPTKFFDLYLRLLSLGSTNVKLNYVDDINSFELYEKNLKDFIDFIEEK